MKIRKSDRLFRKYILRRDSYTCQRCGREYPEDNCQGLHVSHYWGRGRENTRHDPDNGILLCFGCHQLWGHGDLRQKYTDFMVNKLGQEGFDRLAVQAYTFKKRDDYLDEAWLNRMLQEEI